MAIHFEPFLHLAGLTHDDALLAWGGFFFRTADGDREWKLVNDPGLEDAVGDRHDSIGARSQPYGAAEVEVIDVATGDVAARASTADANHVVVSGLQPDTEYAYRVTVDGEPFGASACRSWHDSGHATDLVETQRTYDRRFRTFPHPDEPAPLRFAVLGDYGVGILSSDGVGRRQRHLAAALERAVDHAGVRLIVTTGDNIYLGEEDTVAGTGRHDADWYYSFYEPYRFSINRVPFYPGVGNHDTDDTESSDDREQLADNMFTELRFADGAEVGRSSIDPGLFYRFSYGADVHFVAIDSTGADSLREEHFVDHPRHRAFLEEAFTDGPEGWRIPFSHHPPYCAGPKHGNTEHLIEGVVPLLEQGGVRVMLTGHEHNFQHNRVRGVNYIVTGSAGKLRDGRPQGMAEAGTQSWAAEGHLLIVDVADDTMTIHPVTDVDDNGKFSYMERDAPDGSPTSDPIVVAR